MDKRPIGVFDSGLGGLTAVKRLREILPGEDIVYLGDTANVPYGEKSESELMRLAKKDVEFLKSKNVKFVLIACGTVSSVLAEKDDVDYGLPVMGVVKSAAAKCTGKNIGIIGTNATVKAGAYKKEILRLKSDAEVVQAACPEFVPLIEAGRTDKNDKTVMAAVEKYLKPLERVEELLLGCTHYPLLSDAISAVLPSVRLVDAGAAAAEACAEYLENNMLSAKKSGGKTEYFVSSDIESFEKNAAVFLKGEKIKARLCKL